MTEKLPSADIAARAENYTAPVPRGVLYLTAGIDTQDDRLELELVGWNDQYESWSLDYRVFHGDPALSEGVAGSPWQALTAYLQSRYRHELGFDMGISAACIDSGGHKTPGVYSYCHIHRNLCFAVKGYENRREPTHCSRIRIGKTDRYLYLCPARIELPKNAGARTLANPCPWPRLLTLPQRPRPRILRPTHERTAHARSQNPRTLMGERFGDSQ